MKRALHWSLAALALTLFLLPAATAHADSWTGWITDEHCGAKGANAGHVACAKKCMGQGAKLVFYNSADEKIYQIDDQEQAAANLGYEVVVTGTVEGGAIAVESIEKAEG